MTTEYFVSVPSLKSNNSLMSDAVPHNSGITGKGDIYLQ